ncbi:MAG: 2-succinyl-6-hydroxy-2,4-cyclohexadiene-1-carboxylate synthase [Deltaproteobacteria bacterium]|nr:2-succinyl-6-hydroxy-2,4-cyclohexadiene-1-carboxylate synthase [Deltaproteobacteria bacterium]
MSEDYRHYQRHGRDDKPHVLMLHGFLGSGEDWAEVIQRLLPDASCLTVDLPGHGRTRIRTGDEAYTLAGAAAGLVQLLDDLALPPVTLVGYSMGGRLALYLALTYPERFTGLVLESASPGLADPIERQARQERDERLAEELESQGLEEFLKHWYDQPLFNSLKQHPRFVDLCRRRMNNIPAELVKSLRWMGVGRQPSLWEDLGRISLPLLVVVGERDVKFRDLAAQMVARQPAARLAVISGSGHNVHFEKPDEMAEQIKNFILSEVGTNEYR